MDTQGKDLGLKTMSISLVIDDIPRLDLEAKEELCTSDNGTASFDAGDEETPNKEKELAAAIPSTPSEKFLLCKDILSLDQLSSSLDTIATEYGGTSGSEAGFASDSDFWSDDEDDDTTLE
ncbi:hypothetical protein FZEAL_9202 [Fusarium zealandicum]|uniref:Uncharacterized protein n=1 Tax=Fusarium zealandicum TaxID=1053134 RepID=A0A8H4UCD2_9HYPO|nr:hypothetical protein FZEAL_9202 [Fusarium zealandicum]